MKPAWLLALALAFTAAADALLYGADAGANLGALNLLNLALLFALGRLHSSRARWLALAVGALGLSHLWEPNLIALGLSVAGTLSLVLFPRLHWPGDPRAWLRIWRDFLAGFAGQPFRDRRLLWGTLRLPPAVERDFLLPAGLGAAFLGLFLLANPLGDRALAELWDRIRYLELPPFFRMVLWGAGFTWAWGAARCLPAVAAPRTGSPPEIGERAALRCLVLCNGIFLLQNASDALYLWGRTDLPEGLTWAQYAHRGVYPLALSVILAAGFVLVAGGAAP